MRAVAFLIFSVSLFGFLHSGWEVLVARSFSKINSEAGFLSEKSPRYLTRSADEEMTELYAHWEKLDRLARVHPEIKHQLGRAALARSVSAKNTDKKIALFCEAREHFRQAALRSPHNATYQVSWADVDTQLRNPEKICPQFSKTSTSPSPLSPPERLQLAQNISPFSTIDLYLAAIVYLRGGDRNKALSLLRTNQEINPHFTKAQRAYTYNLVRSEQELTVAIPRRYPEVLGWIWHFSREREADYIDWRDTFVSAVEDALLDVRARFKEGKINSRDYSTYIKSIHSIPLVADSEQLRRNLDGLLANIYEVEGNPDWAKVLKYRQELIRIPVLKSLIGDDKLPKQTMLFGWVPDFEQRRAELDVLGRSIGIYLPLGHRMHMLILESLQSSTQIDEKALELMFSQDNLTYYPLSITDSVTTKLIDGRENMVITFDQADFRYLKIRYLGSNRVPKFSNRFSRLIQVYGEKL